MIAFCSKLAISQTVVKKVLLEDYTATWCVYCPQASIYCENLKTTLGEKFIFIQNHVSDNLATDDGSELGNTFSISGLPSGTINRKKFDSVNTVWLDRGEWMNRTMQVVNSNAIASISFNKVSYNAISRLVTMNIDVVFNSLPQNFPLAVNVAIAEDSIEAINDLVQSNNSPSIGGGKNPLENWWHKMVLRKWIAPSLWGDINAIETTPIIGKKYSTSFTYLIPNTWNANQCYLIATLAYNGVADSTKEILNAEQIKMTTSEGNFYNPNEVFIYPNPTNEILNVYSKTYIIESIALLNSMGQIIVSKIANSKEIEINTSSYLKGMYYLKVNNSKGQIILKFNKL